MKLRIGLKIDVYEIFRQEISDSIQRGWNRAYKYNDSPRPNDIQEAVLSDLMNTICDLIDFDDVDNLTAPAEFVVDEDAP